MTAKREITTYVIQKTTQHDTAQKIRKNVTVTECIVRISSHILLTITGIKGKEMLKKHK